jgi:hypothetical protein
MKILIAIAVLISLQAQASDQLALTNPILSPDEAVRKFKSAMAAKESASFEKHVLSVVAFSYTAQQWIIHFDCTTEHPEWESKNCGIHGYIQNNTQHVLLVARNK